MSDNEFPKMVYSDSNKNQAKETEAGSGLFYIIVEDKEQEEAALKKGFRKSLKAKK